MVEKIYDDDNKRTTKEMDRTYNERRLPNTNHHRRKNEGKENKRKTTKNDFGLNDGMG